MTDWSNWRIIAELDMHRGASHDLVPTKKVIENIGEFGFKVSDDGFRLVLLK